VPLIIKDERQGKATTLGLAITLLLLGQLLLAFAGHTTTAVFVALAVFFAGFNFLEAGLPARLSMISDLTRQSSQPLISLLEQLIIAQANQSWL
jgi:hypothetical protein